MRHFTLCFPISRIGLPVLSAVEPGSSDLYVVLHRWLTVVPETPNQSGSPVLPAGSPGLYVVLPRLLTVVPGTPNQFVRYPGYWLLLGKPWYLHTAQTSSARIQDVELILIRRFYLPGVEPGISRSTGGTTTTVLPLRCEGTASSLDAALVGWLVTHVRTWRLGIDSEVRNLEINTSPDSITRQSNLQTCKMGRHLTTQLSTIYASSQISVQASVDIVRLRITLRYPLFLWWQTYPFQAVKLEAFNWASFTSSRMLDGWWLLLLVTVI